VLEVGQLGTQLPKQQSVVHCPSHGRAHRVPLDDLVGAALTNDPRTRLNRSTETAER
jgi:hypothetical protein